MTAMTLPKGSIMSWNGHAITEHNRDAVSVSVERIQSSQRMANGTMRKYIVADKRTWSTSWDDLPHSATFTVDGKWGGSEIEDFYNSNPGAFTLTIKYGDGTTEDFTVMFDDFSKTIKKRGRYDFWSVDVSLVEV